MIPCGFDEENIVLNPPPSMTPDNCEPLSAFVGTAHDGHPVVISCWKVTAKELAEIQRTGRVWLVIHGGMMLPVTLVGTTPFLEADDTDAEAS